MATWLVRRSKMRLPAADAAMANRGDWAGSRLTLPIVWGLPAAVMLLALLLKPLPRAVVWILMLSWMGGVCFANARRCGRTHCRYTGPLLCWHGSGSTGLHNGRAPARQPAM